MTRRNLFQAIFGVIAAIFVPKREGRKTCNWDDSLYCTKNTSEGCHYLYDAYMSSTDNINYPTHNWQDEKMIPWNDLKKEFDLR